MTDPIRYPPTRADAIEEQHFGVAVHDPFRWLENDVRRDPDVAAWVAEQGAVTESYLATLPARAAFRERLEALWNYERFGVPREAGGRIFLTRNDGLQNQSPLHVQEGMTGTARVLLDPNGWSADGTAALAGWEPSRDGTLLAYAVQDGGSDWQVLKVAQVADGQVLTDEVRWAKFGSIAWAANGSGFFYSRFPEPPAGEEFHAAGLNHAVWFHKLGTAQADDRQVFATPDRPKLINRAETTHDGRWLLVSSAEGTDRRFEITLIDLKHPRAARRTLIRGLEHDWRLAGSVGDTLYFLTDLDAPRGRVVAIDVSTASRRTAEVVAQADATLESASLIGNRLILSYLVDARSEVRLAALDGKPLGVVPLPGIGTAVGFDGSPDDASTFFAFHSFAQAATIYRLEVASGTVEPFREPTVSFSAADYLVEQHFFRSADGTRVPLFLVRRADAAGAGPRPLLLYGYGGFGVSLTPFFSPAYLAWLEAGGALAVANIRGGGEYGKAWHDGGRLAAKQNGFDDFIAAAEHLIAQGITTPEQLAIEGGSNGGLLVTAVLNQRPELFAAALPEVGVLDMLRFDRFTAGRYWIDDYGNPAVEADFHVLRAYSPYHNVPAEADFPAVLVATADTDDRVVPAHSFKYAAALQAADLGPRPRLIRIERRAGHGGGTPTAKLIALYADLWAFAARWTGLRTD